MKTNKKKPKNQELHPYSIDKLNNIKPGVKIGFLKFWVSGAAFFLTFTAFQRDPVDLFIAMYFILVLGVEYIVNKVIVWMHNDKYPTLSYLPHHAQRKSMVSLLLTMLYVAVMVLVTYFAIEKLLSFGIPSIGMLMFGSENIGIDPITFGIVYMLADYGWISIKNAIRKSQNKRKTT